MLQYTTKETQIFARLDGKSYPLAIMIDYNLNIAPNGMYTNLNLSKKMRRKKILRDFETQTDNTISDGWLVGWLNGFYGISTFVGYLTPNQFFSKLF